VYCKTFWSKEKIDPAYAKIFLIEKDQKSLSANFLERRKNEPAYSKIFKI